ncbi:OmpH family outer membrane protein [Chondrinema litorale]|uniref:OmpH family outer membrane protein n=1 Tax=Chondrinema litorale TaxID=2994555 RepID=UPI002543AB0B|nr:OmpH family outer membrane protein [Chondrinema litorale]UZR93386.1 OmpH family outer membrane protein [Chondrinema litorale]
MKNLGTILGAIAIVALIPLYIGQFSGKSDKSDSSSSKTGSVTEAGKIAYVNFDTLVQNYKLYEELNQQFMVKRDKAAKQLETRGQSLERELVSFQRRAQANLLSQNEFNTLQRDLANKQQQYQDYQQTVSTGLLEEERDLNQKLYNNILEYLKKYNADNKFDIIFNYREGESIWLAQDALNITQVILDGLNSEYDTTKTEGDSETEESK